ncbi:MAG: caspase family protein [Bacteroidetes bacterium]|nr:caspase family protein [Bacteroidota bacterium]
MNKFLLTTVILCISFLSSYAQNPELVVQIGHQNKITNMAFHPNGEIVASASEDHTIILWDTKTGKQIRTIYGHKKAVTDIQFIENGTKLVSLGESVIVWRTGTWEKILEMPLKRGQHLMTISKDDKWVATKGSMKETGASHVGGGIAIRDLKTGKVVQGIPVTYNVMLDIIEFNHDGSLLAIFTRSVRGNEITLWNTVERKPYDTLHLEYAVSDAIIFDPESKYLYNVFGKSGDLKLIIQKWDLKSGELVSTITGPDMHHYPLNSVAISSDSKMIAADASSEIVLADMETGKTIRILKGHHTFVETIAFDQSNGTLVSSSGSKNSTGGFNIKTWDIATGRELRSFTGFDIPVNCVKFTHDGKALAVGGADPVKMLSLSTVKNLKLFDRYTKKTTDIFFSPDSRYMVRSGKWMQAHWIDVRTGEFTRVKDHLEYESRDDMFQYAICSDNFEKLATYYYKDMLVYDLGTRELVCSLRHDQGGFPKVFTDDGKYLASGTGHASNVDTPAINLYDLSTCELIRVFKSPYGKRDYDFKTNTDILAISHDNNFIAGADDNILIWDFNTGKFLRNLNIEEDVLALAFSPDSKILASAGKSLILWDVASGDRLFTLEGHIGKINSVTFNYDGRLLATGGDDNKVIIWNVIEGKEIATFISWNQSDFVIATPDNYYLTTKRGLEGVAFRIGDKAYPYEQFDLRYNRPDIVLERLGYASKELRETYAKAYFKRLSKMGFTLESLGSEFHLPEIEILNISKIPISTNKRNIKFKVASLDAKYKLDRINVWVNDVPVFGIKGISLKDKQLSESNNEISIKLSEGRNKIQVSVLNEKGTESLRESIEITYTGPTEKPDLYFVAIGVREYVESSMNLTYSDKDASDLITLFKSLEGDLYENVYVSAFLNEDATAKNILQVGKKLKQSDVDDEVIIFFSGHGLLDSNMDYYLATHDVDFRDPSKGGLNYADLENLLDGIDARKKLLLIDACNSGEVDKAETTVITEDFNPDVQVVSKGFETKGVAKVSGGLTNSFELMKELFADLRRGSGASVISSSSGREYSIESAKWQNGAFTYAIIEGLENNRADMDGENGITINELSRYVSLRVVELTNGKQNPTMRQENLEFDFRVW